MSLLRIVVMSLVTIPAWAQVAGDPVTPTPTMSAAAAEHRAIAQAAAGTRWASNYEFFCGTGPRSGNNINDANITPQKIFDDLSIMGDRGTVVFVLKTNAGVVLIDSSYADKTESVLLPGLKALGIDPASVKYIFITHGHADHFGGASYFQNKYGTRIVASETDWQTMADSTKNLPPSPPTWMLAAPPKRDIAVKDGEAVKVGKLQVKAYLIPGHTPGALGFIFPVHEGRQQHMAAIFGGTILATNRISNDGLREYIQSLQHFSEATAANKVDVEFQNHPLFDDTWVKAEQLAARAKGAPNPFVVGAKDYQGFLTVISECMQAKLAERP